MDGEVILDLREWSHPVYFHVGDLPSPVSRKDHGIMVCHDLACSMSDCLAWSTSALNPGSPCT